MTVRVQTAGILALGALIAALGDASPVLAQTSPSATQVSPLPSRRIEPQRRIRPSLPPDEDTDTPTDPTTVIRPIGDPQPTEGDPEAAPQDGDDPVRPVVRRPRDGEPPDGIERPVVEDGVLPVGEPEPTRRDGDPTTDGDGRLRADIDAFERPAAGYDALAFQIESVEPILDRRPARLARFEPYDPVGIKRGSWIIFPEIEIGLGGTTNVRRAPAADPSAFGDVRPTLRAVTNWRVHAIELRATGLASAYPGFMSENDKAYAIEARGRYDFTRRTNLEVLVSHARDQEGRQARDAVDAASERSDIDTTRAALALNHSFNRLAVQLRGSITDTNYAPVVTNAGALVSNNQRDVITRDAAARATWTFKPTLAAFTEVQLVDRHYKSPTSDGILRDSSGYRALMGLSFGNSGRIWRGELAIGYGEQRPDDARIGAIQGVIIDANLGWRMSELTSLLLTARTDLNDSTTVGQSGSVARTVGAEVRHAFRRHLIGTAGLRQTLTDYRGIALSERETTGELGVEYFLNQSTTLFGRYAHVMYDTSTPGGDYTVDTIRFGVRWRQ